MEKIFGTDGVRGKANSELTPDMVLKLGKAAGMVLTKGSPRPRIIIGKDTRVSGDMLEAALAAGLCSVGVSVTLLGVIPTPGVAVLCRELGADGGVVISASHNPFLDNGIKFFAAGGHKLSDEVENEIEALMKDDAKVMPATGCDIGTIECYNDAIAEYGRVLAELLPVDLNGINMVLDTSHGAAAGFGAEFFRSLGAEVTAIGDKPDGCNINDGCGSLHPEKLAAKVLETGAGIGVAFDGDADRIIVVDEKGRILNGDFILAICAQRLYEKGELANNALVVTQMSNMGLPKALSPHVKITETKVGDRYVLEGMKATGAALGGEQSGHIIFSKYNTTGDGMVTALFLLGIMAETGKPLSELAEIMEELPQELTNVYVSDKKSWEHDEEVLALVDKGRELLGNSGRIIVRASGTESLLRVMAEGTDPALLKDIVAKIAALLEQKYK